jgi:protein-tyrosine phosphatase
MRSPMAHLMFERAVQERRLSGLSVSSAGIHASAGNEAHPRAQIAARALGLPLDHHRSHLLTSEMVSQADAILAMDFQNKAELLAQYPSARAKIFMMSAYAEGRMRFREIPDPYFGDQEEAFRCYAVLGTCVQNLVKTLLPLATQVSLPKAVVVH